MAKTSLIAKLTLQPGKRDDLVAAHSGSDAMAAMFAAVGSLVAGAPELNMVRPTMAKGLSI